MSNKQYLDSHYSIVNNSVQRYNNIMRSDLLRDNIKSDLELNSLTIVKLPLEIPNDNEVVFNKPHISINSPVLKENEIREEHKRSFLKADKNIGITKINKEIRYKNFEEKNAKIKNSVEERIKQNQAKILEDKIKLTELVTTLVKEARAYTIKLKKERLEILCNEKSLGINDIKEIQEFTEKKVSNQKEYQSNTILTGYGITFNSEDENEFNINNDLLYNGLKKHINPVDLIDPNFNIFEGKYYKCLRQEICKEIMLIEERIIVKIFRTIEEKLKEKQLKIKLEQEKIDKNKRLIELEKEKERQEKMKKRINASQQNQNQGYNQHKNSMISNSSSNKKDFKEYFDTKEAIEFTLKRANTNKTLLENENNEFAFLENNITSGTITNNNKKAVTLNSINDPSTITSKYAFNSKDTPKIIKTKENATKRSGADSNLTRIKEIEAKYNQASIFKSPQTSTNKSKNNKQSAMEKLQSDIERQNALNQYKRSPNKNKKVSKNIDLSRLTNTKNTVRLDPLTQIDKIISITVGVNKKKKTFMPNTYMLDHFFNLKASVKVNEAEKKIINDFRNPCDIEDVEYEGKKVMKKES
jgi:hypothetical protein